MDSQYEKHCKEKFAEIIKSLNEIKKEQKILNERLFYDNGVPCHQTLIDRNSRWIRSVTGVLTVIGTTVIGIIGWIIKSSVTK